jgi:16S rRNA processing protein RimM
MINRDELVPVGHFRKPHGTKGEIACSFTTVIAGLTHDSFSTDVIAGLTRNPLHFLICQIDGIFVPFRIVNYRFISDSSAYIQLKTVDSEEKARELAHKEVFLLKKYVGEEIKDNSLTWDYFIGFTLIDEQFGKIGAIVDVDTTTLNTLFIVEKGNEEILIPAVEEFIIQIDENQKELIVTLPEGLVE